MENDAGVYYDWLQDGKTINSLALFTGIKIKHFRFSYGHATVEKKNIFVCMSVYHQYVSPASFLLGTHDGVKVIAKVSYSQLSESYTS